MYYLLLYMYLSFISSITCMHEAQSRSFSLKIAHIHCHESIEKAEKVWHVSRQVGELINACIVCYFMHVASVPWHAFKMNVCYLWS